MPEEADTQAHEPESGAALMQLGAAVTALGERLPEGSPYRSELAAHVTALIG